jgi:hypothetical protein
MDRISALKILVSKPLGVLQKKLEEQQKLLKVTKEVS